MLQFILNMDLQLYLNNSKLLIEWFEINKPKSTKLMMPHHDAPPSIYHTDKLSPFVTAKERRIHKIFCSEGKRNY